MRAAANYDVEGDSPSVYWRLPTIYDWEQANLNGVSKVLPRSVGNSFWSASVYSAARHVAWYFYGYNGDVHNHNRSSVLHVRCVGR
jgi:hypothetical protein